MRLQKLLSIAAASLLALLSLPLHELSVSAARDARPLSVCRDADGKFRTGALDVELLLDNSKSLNTTKSANYATDPTNMRYDAIRDLLVSLGSVAEGNSEQRAVDINFGMITFGKNATERIPLTSLTSSNAETLAREVENQSPINRQESVTNYVVALKKALLVLEARPTNNCKFLVWFTDGQFELFEVGGDDPERELKIKNQVGLLNKEVCSAGGLASKFQQLRINTFVLVLQPKSTDDRLGASYGAMQAITGAVEVPTEVQAKSVGDLCGGLGSREHLGEILVAENAADIARVVTVIAPPPTTTVTNCPMSSSDSEMPAMPAARHLAVLSFSAYGRDTDVARLDRSRIIDAEGQSYPFANFLESIASSKYQHKYKFNDRAIEALGQGWTFDIEGGGSGWCVQVDPHRFEVRFTDSNETPVEQVSKGGRLTEADLKALKYQQDGGKSLDLDSARTSDQKVVGFLDIDPTGKILGGPIQVEVKQVNTLSMGCESFELRDSLGRDMPKSKTIFARCVVDTSYAAIRDVKFNVEKSKSLDTGKCNATIGIVESEGDDVAFRPTDLATEIQHPDKSRQTLWVVLRANGRSASCSDEGLSKVIVNYQSKSEGGQSKELPIFIDVEWERVPIWWVVILATVLCLAFVAVFVLFLLGQLTRLTTRLPQSGRMMGYEVPIRVERAAGNGVRVLSEDGSDLAAHSFDVGRLIRLDTDSSRRVASLTSGSRRTIHMKYPPLWRPFDSPHLILESPKTVYYWRAVDGARGLSPLARSGLILHSPQIEGGWTRAIATLLLPSVGDRQVIVSELLTSRATTALAPSVGDGDWFGTVDARSVSMPISEEARQSNEPTRPIGDSPPTSMSRNDGGTNGSGGPPRPGGPPRAS